MQKIAQSSSVGVVSILRQNDGIPTLNMQKEINFGPDWFRIDDHKIESSLHVDDDPIWNAALDGIESLMLAQHCAGIDVTSDSYTKALAVCLDACANNYAES